MHFNMHKSSYTTFLSRLDWAGGISHLLKVKLGRCCGLVSLAGKERGRHHLYSAGLYWMLGDLQQSKVLALPNMESEW